jgi:hypothetical protein
VCSPTIALPAGATITAYCGLFTQCLAVDGTDGLQGILKDVEVLETAVAQTVNMTTSGAPTKIVVPALPPVNYPPITFIPNASYTLTVASVPSDSDGKPKFSLVIQDGTNNVHLICKYGVTLAAGANTAAALPCIPSPIATK